MGSRFRDNCPLDCKVYVGELGTDGSRHELEEAFGYYGPLRNVWVARNPPGFAFVMFQVSFFFGISSSLSIMVKQTAIWCIPSHCHHVMADLKF